MGKPSHLICPISLCQGTKEPLDCAEKACAWWYRPGVECAILALVKELHHHLANIAGNTAKIG